MKANHSKFTVRSPETKEEFEEYYLLRWKILREPWNQPKGSEKDDLEETAGHLAAFDGKRIVGCGRVHLNSPDEAQVRYMAVDEKYRRRGIGHLLIMELEKLAIKRGVKIVVLSARDSAVDFYKKHGYLVIEKDHLLFGSILHWKMKKELV
jgi:ribosomal protein S18 acetylase RimI-like enzyme